VSFGVPRQGINYLRQKRTSRGRGEAKRVSEGGELCIHAVAADSSVWARFSVGRSNPGSMQLSACSSTHDVHILRRRPTDLQEYACMGSDLGNAEAPTKGYYQRAALMPGAGYRNCVEIVQKQLSRARRGCFAAISRVRNCWKLQKTLSPSKNIAK